MAAVARKVVEVVLPKWSETDDGYLASGDAQYEVGTFGQMSFAELIRAKSALDQRKAAMEEEERVLRDALMVASYSITAEDGVDISDLTGVDGSKFVRRSGTSPSKLDAQTLVANGVTMAQIEAATIEGKSYDYVQLVVPKVRDTPTLKAGLKPGRR